MPAEATLDVDLPPLPGPAYGWSFDYYDGWHYDEQPKDRYNELNLFTEEQMRYYAIQAVLLERERAARVCERLPMPDMLGDFEQGYATAREGCAAAIRGKKE